MLVGLSASIFALFFGPLIYQSLGPMRRLERTTSAIVLVVIGGIVLIDLLPELWGAINWLALLFIGLGLMGPTLAERTFVDKADSTHKLTLYLGIFGLLAHTFIDGTMLAIPGKENFHQDELALAIIVHRLPVGLTVWWLLHPILSQRKTLMVLFAMAFATIAGYYFAESIHFNSNNATISAIQAFVAGSLLHVVIYKPHTDGCLHTNPTHQQHSHSHNSRWGSMAIDQWSITGYLIGLFFLWLINYSHSSL